MLEHADPLGMACSVLRQSGHTMSTVSLVDIPLPKSALSVGSTVVALTLEVNKTSGPPLCARSASVAAGSRQERHCCT